MLKRKSTTEIILISSLTALVSESTGNRDLALVCRGPKRHGSAGSERKVRPNCPALATSGALKVSSIWYWNAKRKRRDRQCPWSCHLLQFLWGQEGLTYQKGPCAVFRTTDLATGCRGAQSCATTDELCALGQDMDSEGSVFYLFTGEHNNT